MLLLLALAALAEEPAVAEPVPTPAATPPAARDVRETWDPAGRLVRRIVLVDGALAEETTATWDADGRPVEQRTVTPAGTTVETWIHDGDGAVVEHTVTTDGAAVRRETFTREKGRVIAHTETDASGTRTTTTTYDAHGRPVETVTRDAAGNVLARTVADRAPPVAPRVPVTLGATGGFASSTDVRSTGITLGVTFARKPPPDRYDTEPLEVAFSASYARSTSFDVRTNDLFKARLGLDYNHLVGRLTAFTFTAIERNPVANLDVDLLVAPVGFKYDIIPDGPFTLDASLAPVWNFRSLTVDAEGTCDGVVLTTRGHCTWSKVRGSMRVRAAIEVGPVKLGNTFEFLPVLDPDDGDLIGAVEEEAIVRDTTTLAVKLGTRVTLASSLLVLRDPLLVEQADCVADPENQLCKGRSIQSGTTLGLAWTL